jgi:hypothetical protein
MYCDKRSNFNMKFVFLRRIIKTTEDYFFLRLYKQKDQYDKKLTLWSIDHLPIHENTPT